MKTLRDLELMLEQYFEGVGELPDAAWLYGFLVDQKERDALRSDALEAALRYVNSHLNLTENSI